MSERYSHLFTLPENLYSEGSPMVITAGALLKDNQTGRILAQLKFRSLSDKVIKAVKVKLELSDTAGKNIGEAVVYDYLDLNASRNTEFGQKTPVPVLDSKARSYQAAVTEVVFEDRSVWTADGGSWEPLSKPSALVFGDGELLKQYKLKFGSSSQYKPKAEKDLWHCTCGTLNHEGEKCCFCHHSFLELQTVDMAKLEEEKNARLTLEAKQAEEEAERNAIKEKQDKKRMVYGAVAVAILLIVFIAFGIVTNSPQYIAKQTIKEGFVHFENKDFAQAESIWQTVEQEAADEAGYMPSAEELMKYDASLIYEYASYLSCKSFTEAIPVYELIPDYQDSVAIAGEMQLLLDMYAGEYEFVSHTEQHDDDPPEDRHSMRNIFIYDLRYSSNEDRNICILENQDDPYGVHLSLNREPFVVNREDGYTLSCQERIINNTIKQLKYILSQDTLDGKTITSNSTWYYATKSGGYDISWQEIDKIVWKKIS